MSISSPRFGSLVACCERRLAQTCIASRPQRVCRTPAPPSRYQRTFSTTTPWRAAGMQVPKMKQKARPSFNVLVNQQKQQAKKGELEVPDDFGIVPGTFIMPRGKRRPGWYSNFNDRKTLEKKRWGTRIRETITALLYRWVWIRPRPRLHLWRIPRIAKELHHDMYTAFGRGNLKPMEDRICGGLQGSLRARIGQRIPNTTMQWTLHKYLSAPRLVSFKCGVHQGMMGGPKEAKNGVVQAVVRIHSLQSIQYMKREARRDAQGKLVVNEVPMDRDGHVLPESARVQEGVVPKDAKESVEYLVIQKTLAKSEEGPWKVWGNAEETTIEVIREQERQADLKAKGKPGRVAAVAQAAMRNVTIL